MSRAMNKIQPSARDCLDLLGKSRKRWGQMKSLLRELEDLRRVVEPWKEVCSQTGTGLGGGLRGGAGLGGMDWEDEGLYDDGYD